jgi:radical SAM enzyme (TIGR01210 family)
MSARELDDWIVAQRPAKQAVDPWRPYAYLVEPERTRHGQVEDVATIFLTNKECPFRCLMCDLWKNTTDERVPIGAIPAQIDWALGRLPPARHVKLYNAGNFFDGQAIPIADWPRIAEQLQHFQTVIIECHPRLVGARCLGFQQQLRTDLQMALGLETVHPEVLPRLNKRMTLTDFERAVKLLTANDIAIRAFLLLRPPYLDEANGIHWAKRSLDFAFASGVECCVVIPTRAGNGAMDRIQEQGHFTPPRLRSMEEVVEYGLSLKAGRVFADLWDAEKFFTCACCDPQRLARLQTMNFTQSIPPAIFCTAQ